MAVLGLLSLLGIPVLAQDITLPEGAEVTRNQDSEILVCALRASRT